MKKIQYYYRVSNIKMFKFCDKIELLKILNNSKDTPYKMRKF